ncbi:MAG: hypothetical protein DWQ01_19595 [Planctomycetota bacterium]|nr:MAG: hypothetical protein DWQ01_19595 [Planctomycetota bacterium]
MTVNLRALWVAVAAASVALWWVAKPSAQTPQVIPTPGLPSTSAAHCPQIGQAVIPGLRMFDNGSSRYNIGQLLLTNISDTERIEVRIYLRDESGAIIRDDGSPNSGGILGIGGISNYQEPLTSGPSVMYELDPLHTGAIWSDVVSFPNFPLDYPVASGMVEYTCLSGTDSRPILAGSISHSFWRHIVTNGEEGFWAFALNGGVPF